MDFQWCIGCQIIQNVHLNNTLFFSNTMMMCNINYNIYVKSMYLVFARSELQNVP